MQDRDEGKLSAPSSDEQSNPRDVLEALDQRWLSRNNPPQPGGVILGGCATTDITQPYHSISYLVSALAEAEIATSVRDFGIEFWHYLISPAVVEQLADECGVLVDKVPPGERLHLEHLLDRISDTSRFRRAFDTLRDPDQFFDLQRYLDAVKELNSLPRLLTLLSHESEYRSFGSASPPGYNETHIDLRKMANVVRTGLGSPVLDRFYEHHAEQIAANAPVFAGFTVPFLSQLEHTLYLGSLLRNRGVTTVMGGPMAAKLVKYADDLGDLSELNFAFDYLATGEGESMIVDLVSALRHGKPAAGIRNLLQTSGSIEPPRLFFENLNKLPSPDYSIWDYGLYASPVPGALYSPTRGCYWNKCAFCDYGLSVDGPTSPWRMRTPANVVADLKAAAPYVSRFFFAVDVLSPSYAQKLSKAVIESGQQVSWMADFRLESTFDPSSVTVFKDAGCIGAAFGMESADQDTLDSIDKGTDVTRLVNVVKAFSEAEIPVQLMGFTGFPGETRLQAEITLATADRLLEDAATVALGKFGLSKGSMVARSPDEYGVEILYERPDSPAIPWDIPWQLKKDIEVYPTDDYTGSLKLLRGFAYPFLGSTSTHHSLLYFERNPKTPFEIPWWHFEHLLPGPFQAIPHFFVSKIGGETVLESALTGRLVVVSEAVETLLESLFPDGRWWRVTQAHLEMATTIDLLEFLTENSLVMYIHEDEADGSPTPAIEQKVLVDSDTNA